MKKKLSDLMTKMFKFVLMFSFHNKIGVKTQMIIKKKIETQKPK